MRFTSVWNLAFRLCQIFWKNLTNILLLFFFSSFNIWSLFFKLGFISGPNLCLVLQYLNIWSYSYCLSFIGSVIKCYFFTFSYCKKNLIFSLFSLIIEAERVKGDAQAEKNLPDAKSWTISYFHNYHTLIQHSS